MWDRESFQGGWEERNKERESCSLCTEKYYSCMEKYLLRGALSLFLPHVR